MGLCNKFQPFLKEDVHVEISIAKRKVIAVYLFGFDGMK